MRQGMHEWQGVVLPYESHLPNTLDSHKVVPVEDLQLHLLAAAPELPCTPHVRLWVAVQQAVLDRAPCKACADPAAQLRFVQQHACLMLGGHDGAPQKQQLSECAAAPREQADEHRLPVSVLMVLAWGIRHHAGRSSGSPGPCIWLGGGMQGCRRQGGS